MERNYFLCLCFMCLNKSGVRWPSSGGTALVRDSEERTSIQTLCFLYSLREKDLLSATYITVFLHYVLQLTRVKKKRMRSAGRRGRAAAALNGIGHTRQTLSEPILLCALLYFFIYFSLKYTSAPLSSQRAAEVNYGAEKFGPAEKKRFGPTDKRQKAKV
ncbi:hypothetical protein QQF64_009108 [Cirrhinus molitorella]|uniref:Uncharacterized protein n=1 Tax=Cirrhinus molitorella TaxID=172907 RepID=A0ABR3M089_9TELE